MKHYEPMKLVVCYLDNDIITSSLESSDNIGQADWLS
jgi:hypothetical protein